MTDTVDIEEDGRYRLRMERHIDHSAATVWTALTDPTRRRSPPWCSPHRVAVVTVLAKRPRLLECVIGETVLRWQISGTGCRSMLVFTHTCPTREGGVAQMGWWLTELDVLLANLDGHTVQDPLCRMQRMTQRCISAFR
nr:hypothetical protein [Rhodococcus wratislaviensis]GLK40571.1 hypothetical protein GCM10017611_74460 [Rhodococcus wratislaviensis]